MYAIFEAAGKQFRAEPEGTLRLPTLDAEPGEKITFDEVLLAQKDDNIMVGQPALDGASVAAEVIGHGRGDKIVVYKMKRRKGYRKKQGHRQGYTDIRVLDITFGSGKPKAAAKPAASKPKAATKPAEAPKAKAAAPKAKPAKTAKPKAAPKPKAAAKPEAKAAEAAADTPVIDVTPTARTLAEEQGIDLASVQGSGKGGRILKSDVEKAVKARDED
ncbi:MAG: 50S ribosomal protein L21 [Gemmatimonadota bacterium]